MTSVASAARERRIQGSRGLALHCRTWLPAGAPVASVLIVHGFAEHSGRYERVAARLNAAGYAVRALDLRGHGLSEGRRTSIVRFADYVDDARRALQLSRAEWPDIPRMLLGHSMGGLVALLLALEDPIDVDALVLSAPAACPGDVSAAMVAAGKMMSRLMPDAPVVKLPLNAISRDPDVVAAYNADPLVFPTRIRARLGAELLAAMEQAHQRLPSLRVPLLVMQGTADRLVDPGCGPEVHRLAGSADKTLKMYDGLWHEIFNEPERDTVLNDLVAWLDAHRS